MELALRPARSILTIVAFRLQFTDLRRILFRCIELLSKQQHPSVHGAVINQHTLSNRRWIVAICLLIESLLKEKTTETISDGNNPGEEEERRRGNE